MSNLIQCPACGGNVSQQVKACPHCGHLIPHLTPPHRQAMKRWLIVVAFAAVTVGSAKGDTLKPGTFACHDEMDALSVHRMMKVDDLTAATKKMQELKKQSKCAFFDNETTAYVEGASFLDGELKWVRLRGETDYWWVSSTAFESKKEAHRGPIRLTSDVDKHLACRNEIDFLRIANYHVDNDMEAFNKAIRDALKAGKCVFVPSGEQAYFYGENDPGALLAQIRFHGETQSWWVFRDSLEFAE